MRHITCSVALGVVSLLGSACGDSSGPSQQRFDATFSTEQTEAPGGRCPAFTVTVTGSGQADPGGPFTTDQSHCVNPAGADSLLFTDGQFAFTFASGATLIGTYSGNVITTETAGVYTVQGDFLFTGGTHEFDSPQGGAGFTGGTLNRQTGQGMDLVLSGIISY